MYNDVSTRAPSFFIGSYSFLHVTRTAIKAWMGLKFSKFKHWSMELAALEFLKRSPEHSNGFISGWIYIILAGIKDNYKSFNEFDFWPHLVSNYS